LKAGFHLSRLRHLLGCQRSINSKFTRCGALFSGDSKLRLCFGNGARFSDWCRLSTKTRSPVLVWSCQLISL